MIDWIPVSERKPMPGKIVETKIDDEKGVRNVTTLFIHERGNLWFVPDGSMYVFYRPTHWREVSE